MDLFNRIDLSTVVKSSINKLSELGILDSGHSDDIQIDLLPFRRTGPNSTLNIRIRTSPQQAFVVKAPRYSGTDAGMSIGREFEILTKIRGHEYFRRHTPEILSLMDIGCDKILISQGIDGEMLHARIDKETELAALTPLLDNCKEFLMHLSEISPKENATVDGSFVEDRILSPLRSILAYYPQHTERIMRSISDFLPQLSFLGKGYQLPLLYSHNDFNPWNIILTSNSVNIVLDWEDCQQKGLPLMDLYNFFTVLFRIMLYGESADSKARSKDASATRAEFAIKAFGQAADSYMTALSIPPDMKDLLFIVFVIQNVSQLIDIKRRSFGYAESWLMMLREIGTKDLFEQMGKKEIDILTKGAER